MFQIPRKVINVVDLLAQRIGYILDMTSDVIVKFRLATIWISLFSELQIAIVVVLGRFGSAAIQPIDTPEDLVTVGVEFVVGGEEKLARFARPSGRPRDFIMFNIAGHVMFL